MPSKSSVYSFIPKDTLNHAEGLGFRVRVQGDFGFKAKGRCSHYECRGFLLNSRVIGLWGVRLELCLRDKASGEVSWVTWISSLGSRAPML